MEFVRNSDYDSLSSPAHIAVSRRHVHTVGLVFVMLMAVACVGVLIHGHSPNAQSPAEKKASSDDSQAVMNHEVVLDAVSLMQKSVLHPVGNFIAAFEPPADASSGSNAKQWGLWVGDPGMEGTTPGELKSHAPEWYNPLDWWKEEHGMIMPNPVPLPPGKYKVYGDTTQGEPKLLSVERSGSWSLEPGVTIDDVTHHPCKAFRYMGTDGSGCAADNEAACTADGSPVEYRVLIVKSQSVVKVDSGSMSLPHLQ